MIAVMEQASLKETFSDAEGVVQRAEGLGFSIVASYFVKNGNVAKS